MSRFASMFQGRLSTAHEHQFAQSVSVVTPDGETTPTPAVLGNPSISSRRSASGITRVMTRTCRFTRLTNVRHDATVTIDGVDWQIEDTSSVTLTGSVVQLVRTIAHEPSRQGYRR